MKETKNVWCVGKPAVLLLFTMILACAVIVPVSAEDNSAMFSQQEIQEIMTAGLVFFDVFEDTLYNSLDDNAKADYMATVLESLSGYSGSTPVAMNSVPGLSLVSVNPDAHVQYQRQTNSILQQYDLSTYSEPLINRESIYYDADEKTFSFRYSNGVLAMVKLVRDECGNGSGDDLSFIDVQEYSLTEQQDEQESSSNAVSGDQAVLIYDIDTTGSTLYNLEYVRDFLLENDPSVTSIIKQNPTVDEYKTLLLDSRVVVISSHGGVYLNIYPSVLLTESVTDTKLSLYESDLQADRVGIYYDPNQVVHLGPGTFALLPKFFEQYYSGNRLNGAYVHLGICSGFGKSGNVNTLLAAKFTASGASAVTGYYKDVYIPYDHGMIKSIARNLADGNSLQSAVNSAKSVQGNTGPNGEYIVVYGNGGWIL